MRMGASVVYGGGEKKWNLQQDVDSPVPEFILEILLAKQKLKREVNCMQYTVKKRNNKGRLLGKSSTRQKLKE